MKPWIQLLVLFFLISCNQKDVLITSKNSCFEEKLGELRKRDVYKRIWSSFTDTLKITQANSITLLHEKADGAIFLKNDTLECLALVLERDNDTNGLFGSARVWSGQLIKGKWKWSKSMWFTFGNDYYKKYDENTFENISKIARYSVLTNGEAKISGCDLDEYYWFTYMKN